MAFGSGLPAAVLITPTPATIPKSFLGFRLGKCAVRRLANGQRGLVPLLRSLTVYLNCSTNIPHLRCWVRASLSSLPRSRAARRKHPIGQPPTPAPRRLLGLVILGGVFLHHANLFIEVVGMEIGVGGEPLLPA